MAETSILNPNLNPNSNPTSNPRQGGVWWFGGGSDLTPAYLVEEDVKHFHGTYKASPNPTQTLPFSARIRHALALTLALTLTLPFSALKP